MRRMLAVLALGLGLTGAACDSTTGPEFSRAGFSVDAEPGRLILANDGPHRVHTVAVEQGTLAVLDLVTPPTEWPALEPGTADTIPNAELIGYSDQATHAVVLWYIDPDLQGDVVVRLQ